jgi:hypothetical protein
MRVALSSIWTVLDLPLRFTGVSAATLRHLASACRSGQLVAPVTVFAVSKVTSSPATLAEDLERLNAEGMSPLHLALLLDVAASAVEARFERDAAAELVWSGPETPYARSRDTRVVLDELFSSARRSVLVSTYWSVRILSNMSNACSPYWPRAWTPCQSCPRAFS